MGTWRLSWSFARQFLEAKCPSTGGRQHGPAGIVWSVTFIVLVFNLNGHAAYVRAKAEVGYCTGLTAQMRFAITSDIRHSGDRARRTGRRHWVHDANGAVHVSTQRTHRSACSGANSVSTAASPSLALFRSGLAPLSSLGRLANLACSTSARSWTSSA